MPSSALRSGRKLSTTTAGIQWAPDPKLFSLEALNTPTGLDTAAISLQTAAFTSNQTGAVLGVAVTELLALDPCVLPLILSYDATLNELIDERLQATFPHNAAEYIASTASQVLERLKLFYFSIPAQEDDTNLDKVHQKLHKFCPLLVALANATFDPASSPTLSPTSPVVPEEYDIPFLSKKHRKKKSIAIPTKPDDKIYRECGRNRPHDAQEATQMQIDLLGEVKDVLQVYISSLLKCHQHAKSLLASKFEMSPNMEQGLSQKLGESSPGISSTMPTDNVASMYTTVKTIQVVEDDIKGFGSWRIFLSGESMRHLRQINRADQHMFDIVQKKMRELSIGFFSESNQKRLVGKDTEVPIYEAKMTRDTRLVYTIDCIPDGAERDTQAIKMFGVYTHAQINSRLWAAVTAWSTKRGAEYRKRCLARRNSKQSKDYAIPCSWPPLPEEYESTTVDNSLDKDISLELHALLTHEKFVPLTQAVLNSILADEDATHPFAVSHREHEIIYHPSSCFVIGRSGTGKTTTMMYKMLGIEKTARTLGDKVRQVFITQSKVLAEKVEESFANMMQTFYGQSMSAEEQQWHSMRRKHDEKELVELDADDDNFSNLPLRFSELEDTHFPLFLTFDKLCKLLEADFKATVATDNVLLESRHARQDSEISSPTTPSTIRRGTVTSFNYQIKYEDFHAKYWATLPQPLTKGLDPALVWNEFQGVIRGSELSLQSSDGALCREQYESDVVSFRKQAAFARHRSRLYDLFEAYSKRKKANWDRDAADRTHSLLQDMQCGPPKAVFDYIYVDEVQDNLMIDSKLLRLLCRNPCGMFWAGDTAQQITSTAFRFSELKAFLYRVEEADPAVQMHRRTAVHPKEFTLSINYRSHGGIINCAHSVIQLLTSLWPDAIDTLDPERGLVNGPKPILFRGWDRDSVHYEQFLFGEASNRMEFGAEQCILVRNDAARERLRSQIGDVGLIMTLYESKGLEFNDVLLYNFFEDSVIDAEWRVVLNAVEEKKRSGLKVPSFNELRHLGVCSELKFLYVGLTRARNHLWIWDSSPEAEFMKIFWESQDVIDIKKPGDPIPRLAVSSSTEEWAKMGRVMFARENYQQAVVCFDRAHQSLEANISRAYHLRKVARLVQVGSNQRKQAFNEAAGAFFNCALGDHKQTRVCYLRAGECYAEAENDSEASKAFCLGQEYTKGAKHARMAGEFDRALEIIQEHTVEAKVASTIVEVCKVVYVREESYSKARDLFDSEEELLQHVDDYGFNKTTILIELGRLQEAAENELKNGRTVEAIDLLLRHNTSDSIQTATVHLLDQLWLVLPYNQRLTPQNTDMVTRLLNLAKSVTGASLVWSQEVKMFEAISQDDDRTLYRLANEFSATNLPLQAVRCTYHLLDNDVDIRELSPEEMDHHLTMLHIFGSSLRHILRIPQHEIAHAAETRKLLAYTIIEDSASREAVIHVFSPLQQLFSGTGDGAAEFTYTKRGSEGEHVALVTDISGAACLLLNVDLRRTLEQHDNNSRGAYAFSSLCLANLEEKCRYGDKCTFLHTPLDTLQQSFNQRFRLYLCQILVINDMYVALDFDYRVRIRMYWMSRLVHLVYPQHSSAGKLSDFDMDSKHPETRINEGLAILREWIRESIYTLNLSNTPRVLEVFLVSSALDHYGVPQYIHRTNLQRKVPPGGYRIDRFTNRRRIIYLDLYNGLFSHGDTAMRAGIDYLHHAIETRMELDANVLISMLEVVTALLLAGLQPDLNGLVITQSWLFVLGQRRRWPTTRSLPFTDHLLNPLMRLSKDINAGSSHLTLDRKLIRDVAPVSRRMLIERVFRCLILVGCNAKPGSKCTTQILQSINGLSIGLNPGESSGWPSWYLRPINWDALVGVAVRSLSSSKTDAIIQLVKVGSFNAFSIQGVPRRFFKTPDDLFSQYITSPLVQVKPRFKLNPNAKHFVPTFKRADGNDANVSKTSSPFGWLGLGWLSETRSLNTEISDIVDNSNAAPFTGSIEESELKDSYTEREKQAALTISTAYQRYRRRRRVEFVEVNGLSLRKWFKEFSDAQGVGQNSRYYLCILQGPLPHLMICFDTIRSEIAKQKASAKKALIGDHRALEDALFRMNGINSLNKAVHNMIHKIGPTSHFHNKGDQLSRLDAIRQIIQDTHNLLSNNFRDNLDIWYHFNMAYKGIVQVPIKKVVLKEIKPELNTSDILE